MTRSLGIHHVTAIAGDPQRNLDFYVGTLGLRLVKRTINFDDPTTYHFYFGDATGRPGSLLTFFPWAGAYRGRPGAGEVGETAFAVPDGALDFWRERLTLQGVAFRDRPPRFGEESIALADPDGLRLVLIASPNAGSDGLWRDGAIPSAGAIRGIHSATIAVRNLEPTAELLTEALGFHSLGREGDRLRLEAGAGGPGALIDLLLDPAVAPALSGAGTVHHIAWRARDDLAQAELQRAVLGRGLVTTPVVDRQYFKSIYFREPGGTLFELATDGPGFLIDEPVEYLGAQLRMPARFEPHRAEIEAALPTVRWPGESVEVGG